MSIELIGAYYETFIFSGGEVHVRVTKEHGHVDILAVLNNSDDIMRLLMLADALKRLGSVIDKLEIPYFPYARQDRVCNAGEPLSVKVMADLINTIGARKVLVADPHSDVMIALIDNCDIIDLSSSIHDIIGDKLVICPDAGAEKRILKLKRPYVMATKVRDVSNGQIVATKLYGDVRGKECIIIDDICDGGRTFTELAKVLRENGARTVDLYVTHGLFSKGLEVFKDLIDNIYNYDYNTGKIKCTSTH